MSDTPLTLNDLIRATRDESPSDFQTAFNELIQQRVVDAVEAERAVVAQNYFGAEQEVDDQVDDESTVQPEDNNDENAETNN